MTEPTGPTGCDICLNQGKSACNDCDGATCHEIAPDTDLHVAYEAGWRDATTKKRFTAWQRKTTQALIQTAPNDERRDWLGELNNARANDALDSALETICDLGPEPEPDDVRDALADFANILLEVVRPPGLANPAAVAEEMEECTHFCETLVSLERRGRFLVRAWKCLGCERVVFEHERRTD